MKKKKIVIARWRGWDDEKPKIKEYAYSGHETGMGRTIEHTREISHAKDCGSPAGIMLWMGGHYSGYEAVEVEVEYSEGKVLAFPPKEEVWD